MDTSLARILVGSLSLAVWLPALAQGTEVYNLHYSTFLGGSSYEHVRDMEVDSSGNVYVTGGVSSADFPTTPGAYQETYGRGADAFVSKFDSAGNLIWSTYYGGPNTEGAYAIELDSQRNVVIAGRAGRGIPVTPGAFQTTFRGYHNGKYGDQNAFVAKISADGSSLIWASYVGVAAMARDMAIDANDDIYLPLPYPARGSTPPAAWFGNAYQSAPQGGMDNGAVKIAADGSRVIWATWLGGSGKESNEGTLRVDANGHVYLGFCTESTDIPTTAGAFDSTHNGAMDFYLAKLLPDGSDLVFATYLGSSGDDWFNTHNTALDATGNIYVSFDTKSDFPTSPGAFQTSYGGGTTDWAVAKFSPAGDLIASTFIGGNGYDNTDGIRIDTLGNVYLTGATESTDFPTSANAYQAVKRGSRDAVVIRLSSDFSQVLYGSYMGGSGRDGARAGTLGDDGSLYLGGVTDSGDWPLLNAYQNTYAGGNDALVARFTPVSSGSGAGRVPDGTSPESRSTP